jgi:hypothetical protein
MTVDAIDALARGTAAVITRRGSLLAAGGAGLAALAASSVGARKNIKKRAKKQGKKRCQGQVDQCRSYWEEYCTLTPRCDGEILLEVLACCEYLGGCQTDDYFPCLIAALEPDEPR